MVDPCKACAEVICMGICADQVQYKRRFFLEFVCSFAPHLCRSGAIQTGVSGDDRSDKAADNKS